LENIEYGAWRQRIRAETFGLYHYEMGCAIQGEGNLPLAIAAFRRAAEQLPDRPKVIYALREALRLGGQAEDAQRLHAEHAARDPDYEFHALTEIGTDRFGRHQIDEANQIFREAAALRPTMVRELAPSFLMVGEAYRSLRRDQDALAAFLQSIACDPEGADGYHRAAMGWMSMGRVDSALDSLEEAIRRAPARTDFYEMGSLLLLFQERVEQAYDSGRRIVALQPDNWLGYSVCGHCLQLMNRNDEGLEMRRRAVVLALDGSLSRSFEGLGLHASGRLGEAVSAYEDGVRRMPSSPWPHALLGLGLIAQGRTNAALDALNMALRAAPKFGFAHSVRGLALDALDRTDEAVAAYRSAIEHEPWALRYYARLIPGKTQELLSIYERLQSTAV